MKPRVLFLCSGNSARSQMAEGLLKFSAGDRFLVESAGLQPSPIHPLTVRVMAEIGYDMSGHTSKSLDDIVGEEFAYVITVCANAEARCPFFPGADVRMHWPFDDPAAAVGSDAEKIEIFRRVRDQIRSRIEEWLRETS